MNNREIYKSFEGMNPKLTVSEQINRSELGDKFNPNYSTHELLNGIKSGILDISDPLFTAFTISFDFLGSPLLMNTDSYISCLHNDFDTDNSLSAKIETTLNSIQSNIESNNVNELMEINSSTYSYTTTNSLYSASDYTYLLDKKVGDDDYVQDIGIVINQSKESNKYDDDIAKTKEELAKVNTQIKNGENVQKTIEANSPLYGLKQQVISKLKSEQSTLQNKLNKLESDKEATIKKEQTNNSAYQTQGENANTSNENAENNDKRNSNNSKLFPAPKTTIDLVRFGSGLKTLSDNYPYIFQTIEGLGTAYSNYYKSDINLKGSGDDKISISCLESVDMRVSSLFNKYLNSVYDRRWKRERVPVNLRKFNCQIYVHDTRTFLNVYTKLGNSLLAVLNSANTLTDSQQLALSHLSTVVFTFYECEIIPEETGNIFDDVSNADGDMKQTKFTFKYNDVKVDFVRFIDVLQNQQYNNVFSESYNTKLGSKEKTLYGSTTMSSANKNDDGDLSIGENIYGTSAYSRNVLTDLASQGVGILKTGLRNILNENVYDENIISDAKRALTALNTTNPGTALMQGLISRGVQALAKDNQKTLVDMTKDLITGGIKPNDMLQNAKDFGNVYFSGNKNDKPTTTDLGNVNK